MKRVILICAMLLATAPAATAAGLNLAWNACRGDGGVQNRTFACNTNLGQHNMIGSFVLDSDLAAMSGDELVVEVVAATATLPDWWRLINAGSCRQTSLAITAYDNGLICRDPFEMTASMNIAAYQLGVPGPNSARLLCVNGITPNATVGLLALQEYSVARWIIFNQKSVGTGSCSGCDTPVTITFTQARILDGAGNIAATLNTPTSPSSNVITWQALPTPTRSSTWSAVKSLHR
jgi:hypothetical protein